MQLKMLDLNLNVLLLACLRLKSKYVPFIFILCYAFAYSTTFLILHLSHFRDIYHVNLGCAQAIQNFLCANCQRKRHQCFACGKLGSSDKSTGAEV